MKVERRESILILAAAVCLGLLAGDRLVLSPLQKLWAGRSSRILELERRVHNGRALLDREKTLERRWETMRSLALPPEPPRAEDTALRAIDRWAERSGLVITSLKPQWVQPEDDAPDQFVELKFQATGHGDLESISRFLFELERGLIATKLESVEVGSRGETVEQLSLDLTFSALALPEENG